MIFFVMNNAKRNSSIQKCFFVQVSLPQNLKLTILVDGWKKAHASHIHNWTAFSYVTVLWKHICKSLVAISILAITNKKSSNVMIEKKMQFSGTSLTQQSPTLQKILKAMRTWINNNEIIRIKFLSSKIIQH
jgi:hypothetical protein